MRYLSKCSVYVKKQHLFILIPQFYFSKNTIDDVANRFIYELNQMPSKKNVTVYLDTMRSVEHGNKMLAEIQEI